MNSSKPLGHDDTSGFEFAKEINTSFIRNQKVRKTADWVEYSLIGNRKKYNASGTSSPT